MSGFSVWVAGYGPDRCGGYVRPVEEVDGVICSSANQGVVEVGIGFFDSACPSVDSGEHIIGCLIFVIGDRQHQTSVVDGPRHGDGGRYLGLAGFLWA